MHSLSFRKHVFALKEKEGLTFKETEKRFGVSMRTLFAWQQRIEPKITRNKPATKIDMVALRSDVQKHPDRFQWERAQDYNVSAWAVGKALRRLTISLKKNSVSPQS
jgi:transposase